MLKELFPGGDGSPWDLVALDGVLYFEADDGVHGYEPWRTDGTEAGTLLVADVVPGAGGGGPALDGASRFVIGKSSRLQASGFRLQAPGFRLQERPRGRFLEPVARSL